MSEIFEIYSVLSYLTGCNVIVMMGVTVSVMAYISTYEASVQCTVNRKYTDQFNVKAICSSGHVHWKLYYSVFVCPADIGSRFFISTGGLSTQGHKNGALESVVGKLKLN